MSYVDNFKKVYPNYAQDLASGYFVSLTDEFFNWHVMHEEINLSACNESTFSQIHNSANEATKSSMRVIFFLMTSIHPTLCHSKCNKHGMDLNNSAFSCLTDANNILDVLTCSVTTFPAHLSQLANAILHN